MEARRFDEIARALGAGTSRRRAISTATGGAVAAVLARFGAGTTVSEAADQCTTLQDRCRRRSACCGADKRRTTCRSLGAGCLGGDRCCGLEGAACNPSVGNCDCCNGLFCVVGGRRQARCETTPP